MFFLDEREEELVAELTDVAYRRVLQEGLRGAFVDVELDLWRQIRSRFEVRAQRLAEVA